MIIDFAYFGAGMFGCLAGIAFLILSLSTIK